MSKKHTGKFFIVGALGYCGLEMLWRRRTHWSMALAGGTCLTLLRGVNLRMRSRRLWEKCFVGSFVISGVEFVTGCIVNLALKWNVWDYSRNRHNLLGQICPLYSALWFLLCFPVHAVLGRIQV